MNLLVTALMAWASAATGLAIPDRHPEIVRMTSCEMEQVVMREYANCEDDLVFGALYFSGRMYLPPEWTPGTAYEVSVLLHELVHHMQYEAGLFDTVRCGGELEPLAYEVQIAFLEAANLDAMAELDTDEFTLRDRSMCAEDYH